MIHATVKRICGLRWFFLSFRWFFFLQGGFDLICTVRAMFCMSWKNLFKDKIATWHLFLWTHVNVFLTNRLTKRILTLKIHSQTFVWCPHAQPPTGAWCHGWCGRWQLVQCDHIRFQIVTWQFRNQMILWIFVIFGSGKPRLSGGGQLHGTFSHHASKNLHFFPKISWKNFGKYKLDVWAVRKWNVPPKEKMVKVLESNEKTEEFSQKQNPSYGKICIQGAEGDDEKQVKVATVRKDNTALMENFPLHITIGPKVKVALFSLSQQTYISGWVFFTLNSIFESPLSFPFLTPFHPCNILRLTQMYPFFCIYCRSVNPQTLCPDGPSLPLPGDWSSSGD